MKPTRLPDAQGYFEIDLDVVCNTVQTALPALLNQLGELQTDGVDLTGFYLDTALDRIDLAQAARLVALAHAPNGYRQSPERWERKTRQLLSLPGQHR